MHDFTEKASTRLSLISIRVLILIALTLSLANLAQARVSSKTPKNAPLSWFDNIYCQDEPAAKPVSLGRIGHGLRLCEYPKAKCSIFEGRKPSDIAAVKCDPNDDGKTCPEVERCARTPMSEKLSKALIDVNLANMPKVSPLPAAPPPKGVQ